MEWDWIGPGNGQRASYKRATLTMSLYLYLYLNFFVPHIVFITFSGARNLFTLRVHSFGPIFFRFSLFRSYVCMFFFYAHLFTTDTQQTLRYKYRQTSATVSLSLLAIKAWIIPKLKKINNRTRNIISKKKVKWEMPRKVSNKYYTCSSCHTFFDFGFLFWYLPTLSRLNFRDYINRCFR